ncbi:MAG: polyprenyl synthetase family protein [Xanthomonadales bacterium]|nr:polyprenyl synthetase family protein [Xanthomonadales bacterium]
MNTPLAGLPLAGLGSALQKLIARADAALEQHLPAANQAPVDLHQAMRYAVLGSGKRLRPMLVYAAAAAIGHDQRNLDAPACAVEIIHAYSLVHDDLPAMDDDALRRGQPTCHIAFGEAMAILAGDALQALAFTLLADEHADVPTDSATRVRMLRVLGDACGSIGMAGGQALDLAATGNTLSIEQLELMHARKTGALIRASVTLGLLAAGCDDASVLHAFDRYAGALGLAFQVRDDILDVEGDAAIIGKTAGKDAQAAKPTFPSILGMQASRARMHELITSALAALDTVDADTTLLRELALFSTQRQS